ncbi:MAG: ribosome silencing factor [Puniceicoccales bacterium]|jgi:ribosome-associated protein|nr:ribosome silencing factor [Puniceicoccales bacterium]
MPKNIDTQSKAKKSFKAKTKPTTKSAKRPLLTGVVREKRSLPKDAPDTTKPSRATTRKTQASPQSVAKLPLPALLVFPESQLIETCLQALDEKKAEDLQVVDVRGKSGVTDFHILATGTSEPHLRALRVAIEKVLDDSATPILGKEIQAGSGWSVIGAPEVIVHFFLREKRASYALEQLWKNG